MQKAVLSPSLEISWRTFGWLTMAPLSLKALERQPRKLCRQAYPISDQTVDQILKDDPSFELHGRSTPAQEQMIRDAVKKEQERVKPRRVKQPQTQLGQDIKRAMDAPTSMIDQCNRTRWISLWGGDSDRITLTCSG